MPAPRLVPIGPVSVGTQFWQTQGAVQLTVVAKVSFSFSVEGEVSVVDPTPLCGRDVHFDDDPTRSLSDCSDLAPYVGFAEAILVGTAHVPRGGRVLCRFGAARSDGVLFDRQIWVHAPPGGQEPVERVALTYENAFGGPNVGANPVGSPSPLLVDPNDPSQPASFGPIAKYWPVRAQLLRAEHRKGLKPEVIEVPEGFAWEYFQAAPPDQRIATSFVGDEVVIVDHVHPASHRLQFQLPGVRVFAMQHQKGGATSAPFQLTPDLLRVDTDRSVASLTFRTHIAFDPDAPRSIVAVGVEVPGQTIAWPIDDEWTRATDRAPPTQIINTTQAIRLDQLGVATLPFTQPIDDEETLRRIERPNFFPDTPWGPQSPAPRPVSPDELTATMSLTRAVLPVPPRAARPARPVMPPVTKPEEQTELVVVPPAPPAPPRPAPREAPPDARRPTPPPAPPPAPPTIPSVASLAPSPEPSFAPAPAASFAPMPSRPADASVAGGSLAAKRTKHPTRPKMASLPPGLAAFDLIPTLEKDDAPSAAKLREGKLGVILIETLVARARAARL